MDFDQLELIGEEEDAQLDKYLTFTVDGEEYAIAIRSVTEIIGIQPINTLPEVPAFVKGVINLRGKIIPVVDMRLRFGKSVTTFTDRTCIVVVQTERLAAGLIVDEVSEVMVIDEEDVVPPPDIQTSDSRRYISGIGKVGEKIKLIIDCERLFDDDETESMEGIEEGAIE
ncbi:MAG: chemotaxis protein CheW [Christensenellales bacterium]